MVVLTCNPANLTIIESGADTGIAKCSQWVLQDAGLWESMTPEQLAELTNKGITLMATAVVFWIILKFITKL